MITQYSRRLEEARLELAGNIRRRIAQAIEEKCPSLDIMSSSAGLYSIKDGHLFSYGKEITPDELPLESYSVSELLETAHKVKAE